MLLDGYIRVSDVHGRGGESFISPDVQRDAILGWAKLHGHEIALMHEELDVSGGKTDRPLLNEVMRRIEAGETEGVVVWKLDRFGRTLVGCLELLKRIQDAGANFASVTDQFDLSTPNGRLVLNMMLSIAQFELERIGASWREARTRAMKRGRHMGARAPFGYRKREDGRLEQHPTNGPLMAEMFERRAAGEGWYGIVEWLGGAGAVTASGKLLTVKELRRMVKNEVYLGVLKEKVSGVRLERAHPPLTTLETFAAANTRGGVRRAGEPATNGLLRGLVRCAGCRYVMKAERDSRELPGSFHYRCATYDNPRSTRTCGCPTQIKAVDGEGGARGARGQSLHDYVLERAFERLPEIEAEAFGADTEIGTLETAAKVARSELHLYLADTDIQKVVGRDAFLVGAGSRRAAADDAQRALDEALRANAGRMQQPVRRLRNDWDVMTIEEQQTVLGQLIQAVFVRGAENGEVAARDASGRVEIVWFDDPLVDLPRQGRRDYVARPFVFTNGDDPGEVGVAAA